MIDEKKLILHLNDWMLQESFLKQTKNSADIISDCIKAVEEQPKIGEWIPCNVRLPKPEERKFKQKRTEVLACQKNGIVKEMMFEFETNDFWEPGDDNPILHVDEVDEEGCKIIAWQPLPEPYKEKGSKDGSRKSVSRARGI